MQQDKIKYEIIDNFLDDKSLKELKEVLESQMFPWYYNESVSCKNLVENVFYFTHILFMSNAIPSHYVYLVDHFAKKLQIEALIRAKVNLYTNMGRYIDDPGHIDYNFSHKGALFYLNTNNAPTILKDGTKIKAVENRLLKFDPSLIHNSSHPTDTKRRITINFNYM